MGAPLNPIDRSQTKKNLEAAFAGESMANRKYLYFGKLAREKGDEEVAKLFEETAHQETSHAFAHLELLYPGESMTVQDLLRTALEGEVYETTQMYPEFERTAKREKQDGAAKEMVEQGRESAAHAKAFRDALAKAEKRFAGLVKAEARHAERYREALDRRAAG